MITNDLLNTRTDQTQLFHRTILSSSESELSIHLLEQYSKVPEPFVLDCSDTTICFCLVLKGEVNLEMEQLDDLRLMELEAVLIVVRHNRKLILHVDFEGCMLLIELHPDVLFRNIPTGSNLAKQLNTRILEERFGSSLGKPLILPAETRSLIADLIYARPSSQTRFMYLKAKVLELLSVYLGNIELGGANSTVPHLRAEDRQRMIQIREILEQRFSDQHSLVGLAREVGTNDATLKKCFKLMYGKTVFSYLMEVRMITAKRLLKEKSGVAQVAYEVGYKHSTHFSSAFKKYFGYLPGQVKVFFLSCSGVSEVGVDLELLYSLTFI